MITINLKVEVDSDVRIDREVQSGLLKDSPAKEWPENAIADRLLSLVRSSRKTGRLSVTGAMQVLDLLKEYEQAAENVGPGKNAGLCSVQSFGLEIDLDARPRE